MSNVPFYDWVATDTIYINGARAFTKNMLVPNSTVTANGWDVSGLVVPAPGPVVAPDAPNLVSVVVAEVA